MKACGMHPRTTAYHPVTAGIASKRFGIIFIWLLRILTSFLSIRCDRLSAILGGLMTASALLSIDSSTATI